MVSAAPTSVPEDVDAMLRLLSPIMGGSLRVEIEWNAKKNKFVRRGN